MKKWSDFLEGRCWPGYKPKPGKKAYSPGSCVKEDLRQWFDPDHPKGGWKRINSKGEAIGPCAREPGEAKPKCMSNEKRAKLDKKERASAVASKRKHDPNPERKGGPINVSNFGKGKISENMENLEEKNVPTSPEKWAQAKAQAKAKFDVYPCVPLDSLAISKNGPISHDELNIGDEILTYNMNQDILEWKPIIDKHYYEDAPLLEIGKPTGFSIRCTPNHKWVISKDSGNELVETKDLNTHMRILMCSTLKNDSSLLIENWSKKDNWVEKILSMDEKEREIFLASSVVYDGWDKGVSSKIKDRHTFGFSQKEYDHLWASLLAAYLNGYYVNSREKSEDMTSANYIRNKRYHNTQNLYKKDAGSEDVWCPTTENETWVMIQNGLITITGNSAYANGWAAKKYKEMGGGWKSVSEESEVVQEGRPSQRHPLEGHEYHKKSNEALIHIAKDAHKAAEAMKSHNTTAENKYRDQASDSATVRYFRQKNGMPEWYKKKYGHIKEAKEKTEYDYEGDMARGQLQSIINNSQRVHDMLEDNDNLPEWVQSKITLAEDYISTVANYMMSEIDEEVEQIDELSKDTLKSYMDKSSKDNLTSLMKPGMIAKKHAAKRFIGMMKAGEKLTKEANSANMPADIGTPAQLSLKPNPKKLETPVYEAKSDIPFEGPYSKSKGTITDKSGAKHDPMSRARSLARQAIQKQKVTQKKAVNESRRMEIVREAMVDAKKKDAVKKVEKKVSTSGNDKFQSDPELSSNITKNA